MSLKNYTDGMDDAKGELGERSTFALEHSTGEDTLSGMTMTGKFVPVSLTDTNPINTTATHPMEGDPESQELPDEGSGAGKEIRPNKKY